MYCIEQDEISKKKSVAFYGIGSIIADDKKSKVVTVLTAAHVIETGAHSVEDKKYGDECVVGMHRIRNGKIEQIVGSVEDFTVAKSEFSQDEKQILLS